MTETTRTTKDTAIMIKVSNLYPHPDNPRKDLGDLTELVESIKKNGIMQNLTVIPIGNERDPEEQADAGNIALYSDFRVLIGHRRLAAAKKAGLESVPCRIVSNISRSDQIGIMLEENMQRNDLSIYEQAQSFQMMLDLGETEETISQKYQKGFPVHVDICMDADRNLCTGVAAGLFYVAQLDIPAIKYEEQTTSENDSSDENGMNPQTPPAVIPLDMSDVTLTLWSIDQLTPATEE